MISSGTWRCFEPSTLASTRGAIEQMDLRALRAFCADLRARYAAANGPDA